ncbi:hypothetical protein DUI87_04938 [Hirundo rustica rustica]|uniref:Uncharacterized protein n=1 Tax=Hirundo rustica rustica TaxID=333673 RepID=A0A3M0KXN1_HIRRU|nr:hypothetical protein DUI87_04938 [Hirundo rustica rustica]
MDWGFEDPQSSPWTSCYLWLLLTECLHLKDDDWKSVSVDNGEQGNWPRVEVPTINQEAPRKRYHWRVLPQGLKVSPVICQCHFSYDGTCPAPVPSAEEIPPSSQHPPARQSRCSCLWMAGAQPKANVWATLARAMGQDHICLSATLAENPLMTCLVGIPYGPKELPTKLLEITEQTNREDASKDQSGQERSYQFVYHTKDAYTAKIWCGRIAHVEMASTTDRKPLALPKGEESLLRVLDPETT